MPLMASPDMYATTGIAGIGDPLSPQSSSLLLRIKEREQ